MAARSTPDTEICAPKMTGDVILCAACSVLHRGACTGNAGFWCKFLVQVSDAGQ